MPAAVDGALEAEDAHLAGWWALALLNQLLIAVSLPAATLGTQLRHHVYDLAQLLLLGALSWVVLGAAKRFAPWRRGRGALGLGVLALALGLVIGGDDVAHRAAHLRVPQVWLTLAFGVASGVLLGGARLLGAGARLSLRIVQAVAGVSVFVIDALVLRADYFAAHFMAAWLSAILLANAVESAPAPRVRQALRRLVPVALVAGLTSIAVPARGAAGVRLFALPTAVLAPLVSGLSPAHGPVSFAHVPARARDSAWFQSRAALPPIPPTGALAPPPAPIVLFFTVDALRADVLERPERRALLPELFRLRDRSTVFEVARAPTASTETTMASVFSGSYFSQLGWSGLPREPLTAPTPRFPELLSSHGVRTALVAGAVGKITGESGIARGFAKEIMVPPVARPGAFAVDAIMQELGAHPDGPQLYYSHFIEPHGPYDLAGKSGTPFERYLREVAMVDGELGRLRRFLEQRGLAERTILLVTADHGEAFGEHGISFHGRSAYEELVRVPLLLYVPGRSGRIVQAPVTLLDVGPTVLDLYGVDTPGFWMGQSLLPLVAGTGASLDRPIAIDTARGEQALCLDDGLKVILSRRRHTTEVYDLTRDPAELDDLSLSDRPEIDAAIETTELFFRNIGRH